MNINLLIHLLGPRGKKPFGSGQVNGGKVLEGIVVVVDAVVIGKVVRAVVVDAVVTGHAKESSCLAIHRVDSEESIVAIRVEILGELC